MSGQRWLPAGERPGRRAWLGPIAMVLGAGSWLIPGVGVGLALIAVGCGAVSLGTERAYRMDWTATAGVGLGATQAVTSGLLLLAGSYAP